MSQQTLGVVDASRTTRHDTIAVLDFGGQYVHLIATKIRALGVFSEVRDPDDPVESFRGYKGLILSGSPSLSSHDEDAGWSRGVLDLGIPVLGLCFGHQEIAKHGGGTVDHSRREYGAATLRLVNDSPLFAGLAREETVWMSHGDTVASLGEGFVELGYSISGANTALDHRNAAIACESKRHYGLQFHAEVDDTTCGERIFRNFLAICGAKADWDMGDQVESRVAAIREQVGERSVLLLASGGVDSTVAAILFHRALGPDRLSLLHIDNGLMRKNESAGVDEALKSLGLGRSLHVVDATTEFLGALAGLTEPEKKRKAIGDTFLEVFEREAAKLGLGGDVLLGQGTIYPDTIETGATKRSDVIKTHHNRVPLVQEMIAAGRVVEPLADLYKVEVRELGRALGLDPEAIERHPFPGPGLGIRVATTTGHEKFDDERLHEELNRELAGTGLVALPLPVRSVGVKADLRSYEHPVLLSGPNPGFETLNTLATGLAKTVPGINRCLFELSGRRPQRAEVLAATVTRERLDLLRELDAIVMGALAKHRLMQMVWQCPTVIVPLRLDGRGSELVVVRPVLSERAMTARPAWIGEACAAEITAALLAFEQVGAVALDVTTKPPATIEWE